MANRPEIQKQEQKGPAREERRAGMSRLGMLGRMMLTPFEDESLWSPEIEVLERDGKLLVRADLPGLKPDDVSINVEDDVLTLCGERRTEREEEEGGVYHSERSYGRFERSIALPAGTDVNAIEARFENGVLEVSAALPKQEQRGRKIEIKGSEKKISH